MAWCSEWSDIDLCQIW